MGYGFSRNDPSGSRQRESVHFKEVSDADVVGGDGDVAFFEAGGNHALEGLDGLSVLFDKDVVNTLGRFFGRKGVAGGRDDLETGFFHGRDGRRIGKAVEVAAATSVPAWKRPSAPPARWASKAKTTSSRTETSCTSSLTCKGPFGRELFPATARSALPPNDFGPFRYSAGPAVPAARRAVACGQGPAGRYAPSGLSFPRRFACGPLPLRLLCPSVCCPCSLRPKIGEAWRTFPGFSFHASHRQGRKARKLL